MQFAGPTAAAQEQRARGLDATAGTWRAPGAMNTGGTRPRTDSGGGGGGDGAAAGAGAAPSVRALKLQLFYRLQARGPHGAWTRYWTGFQQFLAARIAIEEFHALARELLADDMRTWLQACRVWRVRRVTGRVDRG